MALVEGLAAAASSLASRVEATSRALVQLNNNPQQAVRALSEPRA
jgi:hypothetical protein